jgi:hypothetical protein
MTTLEALQQAQSRWGEVGHVHHLVGEADLNRFRVGKQMADVFWVIGVGQSWEEAFQAADGNAQKPL